MDISELIHETEEIYKKFMISDNTPDMEADLKIQLLDTISSMLAFSNLKKSPNSNKLEEMINNLREKLLIWDPFGPWFKENKELVSATFNLITQAKTLRFEEEIGPTNIVTIDEFNKFKALVQKDIQNLKEEIKSIKDSITKIKTAKPKVKSIAKPAPKPTLEAATKPTTKPTSKPVSIPEEPIIEIVTKDESKPIIPKPIPLDTPIPGSKSVPNIKPLEVSTPIDVSKPLQIPETPSPSTTIEPERKGPELGKVLSSKKRVKKADSSKLFGLFSKPAPAEVQEKPIENTIIDIKPVTPIKPSTAPKQIPKIVPIQPAPVKPVSIKKVIPRPVPLEPEVVSLEPLEPEMSLTPKPIEISPSPIESSALPETDDPEVLYHDLISLQGKRYGLERNIKELKTLFQSGSMSEEDYKKKLSSKLEQLKKISAKIERIREKLD